MKCADSRHGGRCASLCRWEREGLQKNCKINIKEKTTPIKQIVRKALRIPCSKAFCEEISMDKRLFDNAF